jgi:hypothetical protein
MFSSDFFVVNKKNNISPFQNLSAYLFGSAFQTVVDNPITTYRQLVQQYAKDATGKMVDPKIARQEAINVFKTSPVSASLSGLGPRLVGVGFKRVPKFGFFWGISFMMGENEQPGLTAAVGASIFSAYCINPIRMIEKQQRVNLRTTGQIKPVLEILTEAYAENFKPLFRGTVPLIGHSIASATTGLVGQPQLQKYIQKLLSDENNQNKLFHFSKSTSNLIASAIVSPIYVVMTNPLSRLEVIMQTAEIKGKSISLRESVSELITDSKNFGLRGMFRGQGVGIAKAIISLSMFHEGRMFATSFFKNQNIQKNNTDLS